MLQAKSAQTLADDACERVHLRISGSMPSPRGLGYSELNNVQLPPDQLARICDDAAKGIARALLGQVNQVVEDMRRQYKDHCEVLTKQELVLQDLMNRLSGYAGNSQLSQEAAPGFGCGLCQSTPNDHGNGTSLSARNAVLQGMSMSESDLAMEGVVVVDAKEPIAGRKRKGAPRDVQQWVAQQLVGQIDNLVPTSSPRPLLPSGNQVPKLPPMPPETIEEMGRMDSQGSLRHKQAVSIGTVEYTEEEEYEAYETPTKPLPIESAASTNPPLPRCGGDDQDAQGNMQVTSPRWDEGGKLSLSQENKEKRKSIDSKASDRSKARNALATQMSPTEFEQHKLFGDMGIDKSQLDKEEYDVSMYYKDRGLSQAIARSESFSNLTLFVIFMNALYIGYDADANTQENLLDADPQFLVMENVFCVFFFFEWCCRFLAFASKFNCFKDMWFKFDTILVTMMTIETWILPVALSGGTGIPSGLVKLVRLLRLARMARIMRAFPDLVAMIKGVKVASRAVLSALLMLLGLIYVFAIILFTLLKEVDDEAVHERFRRLGITMWTLLIDGTFLDGIGFVSRSLLDTNNYFSVSILLLFVLLSALTVMNMLIGVLCEVVAAVASAEKEDSAIRMVKTELLALLRELDEDGSGQISRNEIGQVLKDTTALAVLDNLQVDVAHLLEHLEMFFDHAEEDELTIHQIMDLILMLRGDRPPTMKDMLHGQTFSRWKTGTALQELKETLDSVNNRVSHHPSALNRVNSDGSKLPSSVVASRSESVRSKTSIS